MINTIPHEERREMITVRDGNETWKVVLSAFSARPIQSDSSPGGLLQTCSAESDLHVHVLKRLSGKLEAMSPSITAC